MKDRVLSDGIHGNAGKYVKTSGYIEKIRNLGGIKFFSVRDMKGTFQVVGEVPDVDFSALKRYDIVTFGGIAREEPRAPGGYEILADNFSILSSPKENYPISISPKSKEKIDIQLTYRPISVRNPAIRDVFTIQQGMAQGFRNYLISKDFTEIFTPKIVPQVAESGSNMFKLDYFGTPAFLTQSPQFYKQIMMGSGFERVFEVGPVFRAEQHDTIRHLNEYTSMDLEMGFIDSFHDLLDIEEDMLRYIYGSISERYPEVLERLDAKVPQFEKIPRIPLLDMKAILQKDYKKRFEGGKDIDPEGERLATKYAKEKFGSDFIFLTDYPKGNRPFYAHRKKSNPELTDSFDLILNGLEVTTGGQRIHDYDELLESMKENDINPDNCEGYLMAFKYGMPPHGGMGIGLERLTMKTLNLNNVREACLFPRDRGKLQV